MLKRLLPSIWLSLMNVYDIFLKNLLQYTGGFWYELLRYDIHFEKGCNCGFANYNLNDDKSEIAVKNCCKRLPNTTLSCSTGRAVLSHPDEVPLRGMLNVAFKDKRKFHRK